MALTGEQWLEAHFFPIVDSLPVATTAELTATESPLRIIAALRLLGAVDALTTVGVLDSEQAERCRAALELKGATTKQVAVSSFAFLARLVQAADGEAASPPVEPPDRLVRVVADGHVFGIVDGEQALLTSVEVWLRTIRASLLVAISPSALHDQLERSRQMRHWLAKRQAGEASERDRPPMSAAMGHPGAAATWLLSAGGQTREGTVASGHAGSDWWRLEVQWDVAVGDDCCELEISATEEGRVIGRSTLRW